MRLFQFISDDPLPVIDAMKLSLLKEMRQHINLISVQNEKNILIFKNLSNHSSRRLKILSAADCQLRFAVTSFFDK